jgi:hypothetical protein
MRIRSIVAAAVAAGGVAAGVAAASGGGPPPGPDPPAPQPGTVVAHGSAQAAVAEPSRRTNRSVDRSVRAAQTKAIPAAVAAARAEAAELAAAAGLTVGEPIGVARDVSPLGYGAVDDGYFGPGRWCGPTTTWRGGRRRTRHRCQKPARASVRVTVTLSASRR